MAEPQDEKQVRVSGAFVEIAENVWVNASHVAAIVPIDGVGAGPWCRVYVAGPSLGGGHALAWNSRMTSIQMATALTMAQADARKAWGFWEEKGRLVAQGEIEEDDD